MSRTSFLALLLALLAPPQAAGAWSRVEHEVICEVTWLSLSPAGRAFVQDVRSHDPERSRLFRGSCYWADRARRTTHPWTAPYHYINIAAGDTGGPRDTLDMARDCPDGACVTRAVERYSLELFRPATSPDGRVRRAEALKFLAHFVGDLHQPLHAGRPEDRGGNGIEVTWFGEETLRGDPIRLHQVWDGLIGRRAGLRAPAAAIELLEEFGPAEPFPAAGPDPRGWTMESHALAERYAYDLPADLRLDDAYYGRARDVVRRQLWRAGTRLAALIEAAAAMKEAEP